MRSMVRGITLYARPGSGTQVRTKHQMNTNPSPKGLQTLLCSISESAFGIIIVIDPTVTERI